MEIKEKAIKSLYQLCCDQPVLTLELCGNIIETISKCYQPKTPLEVPSMECQFLIDELTSFAVELKERSKEDNQIKSSHY